LLFSQNTKTFSNPNFIIHVLIVIALKVILRKYIYKIKIRILCHEDLGYKLKNELQRIVLGGPETKFLADVDPEQKNKTYATDKTAPILWYSIKFSVQAQAKFLIH